MTTIGCEIGKWDGRTTYRFDADLLGRDEYGTWLGLPAPTSFVGPKGPAEWKHNFVICVPEGEWWFATFNDEGDPKNMELYVDVSTVPVWPSASEFGAVDLDLDVVRFYDGRTELKDADQFEERRVEMGYPDDVVERARSTADALLTAVRERREPFDSVGRAWLGKLEANAG
jgi:hypothetical protein